MKNAYFITEEQEKLLALVQFNDLETACEMLDISPEILLEWQTEKHFPLALRAIQDKARAHAMSEVTKEIQNLLIVYRNHQEHLEPFERLKFLENLLRVLKETVPPPMFEHSQLRWLDARDAQYWRDQEEDEEEEEEYEDDEDDEEYREELKRRRQAEEARKEQIPDNPRLRMTPEEEFAAKAKEKEAEKEDEGPIAFAIKHDLPEWPWDPTFR